MTLAGDPEREASIAARLAVDDRVELFMRCVDRVEVLASIRGGSVDGLIAVAPPAWLDSETVDEAHATGIKTIGLARDPLDAEIFRSLGVTVLTADPTTDEILAELARDASLPPPPAPKVQGAGRILAVWGPKGAPGRSRISMEMAFVSAAKEARTLLVDADPYGGDLLQLLGVVEELPTIVWAARAAAKKSLDRRTLQEAVRRTGDRGPVLLPGLARPELASDVSEKGLRSALDLFRSTFATTIVDTGFCIEDDTRSVGTAGVGRDQMTRCVLAGADRVVAVCRADPVGIKNFAWAFERLQDVVGGGDVVVVVNRVLPGQEREIEAIIRDRVGLRPIALIPDRHEEVTRSVLAARALAETKPGSEIPLAVSEILAALGSNVARRGLLTRLGGRA